jgi:hypothetical protein
VKTPVKKNQMEMLSPDENEDSPDDSDNESNPDGSNKADNEAPDKSGDDAEEEKKEEEAAKRLASEQTKIAEKAAERERHQSQIDDNKLKAAPKSALTKLSKIRSQFGRTDGKIRTPASHSGEDVPVHQRFQRWREVRMCAKVKRRNPECVRKEGNISDNDAQPPAAAITSVLRALDDNRRTTDNINKKLDMRSESWKAGIRCFHCAGTGHIATDCQRRCHTCQGYRGQHTPTCSRRPRPNKGKGKGKFGNNWQDNKRNVNVRTGYEMDGESFAQVDRRQERPTVQDKEEERSHRRSSRDSNSDEDKRRQKRTKEDVPDRKSNQYDKSQHRSDRSERDHRSTREKKEKSRSEKSEKSDRSSKKQIEPQVRRLDQRTDSTMVRNNRPAQVDIERREQTIARRGLS